MAQRSPFEKKTPQNPKYANVGSRLNTGLTVDKVKLSVWNHDDHLFKFVFLVRDFFPFCSLKGPTNFLKAISQAERRGQILWTSSNEQNKKNRNKNNVFIIIIKPQSTLKHV